MLHRAGEGALRAPFEPPASRGRSGPPGGALRPPFPAAVHRWLIAAPGRHISASRRRSSPRRGRRRPPSACRLSDQLRQAMARTRTWTAAAADVERERTSQVARIGNNLTCLGHLVVWVERQQIPKERITVTQ